MPRGFETMRDAFIRAGLVEDEAQAKAARIWNSKHPDNPVGRGEHRRKKKGKNRGKKT